MEFNIENIRIIKKNQVVNYSWFKLWIAKLLKLELVKRYQIQIEIRLFKNCLIIGQYILIGNHIYIVVAKKIDDNMIYIIFPYTPDVTQSQISTLINQKNGRLVFQPFEEKNFQRLKY